MAVTHRGYRVHLGSPLRSPFERFVMLEGAKADSIDKLQTEFCHIREQRQDEARRLLANPRNLRLPLIEHKIDESDPNPSFQWLTVVHPRPTPDDYEKMLAFLRAVID